MGLSCPTLSTQCSCPCKLIKFKFFDNSESLSFLFLVSNAYRCDCSDGFYWDYTNLICGLNLNLTIKLI